jgi:hypothetical protein
MGARDVLLGCRREMSLLHRRRPIQNVERTQFIIDLGSGDRVSIEVLGGSRFIRVAGVQSRGTGCTCGGRTAADWTRYLSVEFSHQRT